MDPSISLRLSRVAPPQSILKNSNHSSIDGYLTPPRTGHQTLMWGEARDGHPGVRDWIRQPISVQTSLWDFPVAVSSWITGCRVALLPFLAASLQADEKVFAHLNGKYVDGMCSTSQLASGKTRFLYLNVWMLNPKSFESRISPANINTSRIFFKCHFCVKECVEHILPSILSHC